MKLENCTASQLTKRLDKAFSLFIRYRDTDEDGYGNCATCGKNGHYKEMDAGHFISRNHHSVRWNEFNCHLQCPACNRYRGGEQYKMGRYIARTYGDDIPPALLIQREVDQAPKRADKIYLIKKYEELNKKNKK